MFDHWFGIYSAALIGADLILTIVLFIIASPTPALLMGLVALLLVGCIARTYVHIPRRLRSHQS